MRAMLTPTAEADMPLTLLLRCNDPASTRDHYRDVLGFTVTDSFEPTITAQLEDSRLIFTGQDLWSLPVSCSGTFYFAVSDVERYYQSIKDKAEIVWPLQEMAYGSRDFGIRDCNGYHLAFSQIEPR
ncbi:VOC family protein [Pseudomonas koreensis]|uniref:Bleomycin resistance family protein n=1 Tax=Pseudomonas koreensis TaxID=198620 RepID=A0A9X3B433_9PSED|nr:VOC family protein [Pseudomonas koreensis]MCU7250021.1 bleomycin resistance family protein [Pseudomonas koreensis]